MCVTPEVAGALDFPFVQELLEYWLECPPEHLLMKMFVGYERKKVHEGNWRKQRAIEMDDREYQERQSTAKRPEEDPQKMLGSGIRKLDCAPPHIQQAAERARLGKQMEVPNAPDHA